MAPGGGCTLRAAVEEANARAGPDAIRLPAGAACTLRLPAGVAPGAGGGLVVRDDLEVEGAATTVAADGPGIVFDVVAGELRLRGLTVEGAAGPGIRNAGRLVVVESTLRGNRGGGLENLGEALVERSTIAANGEGRQGAGVDARDARTTLVNATVSGNAGGGITNERGEVELRNATVAMNLAIGVANRDGRVTAVSSLLAQNEGGDCEGELVSGGYNVVRDVCVCRITGDRTSNVIDVFSADLDPLADNGGPTPTHALRSGSVAIDVATRCEAVDQRGTPRPLGGACDAGAYEATPDRPPGRVVLRSVRTRRMKKVGLRAACSLGGRPRNPDAYCDAVGYTEEVRGIDGCPEAVLHESYRDFRGRRKVRLLSRLTPAGRALLATRGRVPIVLVTEVYDGERASTTATAVVLTAERPFLRVRGPLRSAAGTAAPR